MHLSPRTFLLIAVAYLHVLHLAVFAQSTVVESERRIPVAYDVDVVVIGGSSAGVAAAVEAASNGASVFLASQPPYLGEDLCGTYRLWLEPGEVPSEGLGKEIFDWGTDIPEALPFTYAADLPSNPLHPDNGTVLTDGFYSSAVTQSVQYDGDLTIVATLGEKKEIGKVHVMAYQRDNDFEVDTVDVSISDDSVLWTLVETVANEKLGQGSFETSPIDLCTQPVMQAARYIKFHVMRGPAAGRVLLGEIIVEPSAPTSLVLPPPPPMHVKRILEQALFDANVEFLFGCYPTDVLRSDEGNVAGIVMANRSGRQAVKAKVLIDTTPRASVARIAGATFVPYPKGPRSFQRIVVGGAVPSSATLSHRILPIPLRWEGSSFEATEYTLTISMEDGSYASFAEAEQIARDLTWQEGQVAASARLFQVPPDPMQGHRSLDGEWPGADQVDPGVFQPEGIENLYVLGGCADMSRAAAERMLRPLQYIQLGCRIGQAAALLAEAIPDLHGVHLEGTIAEATTSGAVCEFLYGIRGAKFAIPSFVQSSQRSIPVLGQYDVVVIGGGTGGAPAGIAAARQRARTLVVEFQHGLGGIGTLGMISKYWYGYRTGFTAEVDAAVGGSSWDIEKKMEWYRRQLRQAGGELWIHSIGCGAFVEGQTVKGVVVTTPEGRGILLCHTLIDSTGNSDIAVAAGASYRFIGSEVVAMQGTGLSYRNVQSGYTNTDWSYADELDTLDTTRMHVVAKEKFKDKFDVSTLISTRERRSVLGEYTLSPLDIVNNRTFSDTIMRARSNWDSHGYTIHPLFRLWFPERGDVFSTFLPYRCLLPQGLDRILVTGLGVSAHRDAVPIIRMQADIQNQGYAAGVAAAMAVGSDVSVREIDIRALQQHLVDTICLPEQVLTDVDSPGASQTDVQAAISMIDSNYEGVGIILDAPDEVSIPLLRQAYLETQDAEKKRVYAHILGLLGDGTGLATLIEKVESSPWDFGWTFMGAGNHGSGYSLLDSMVISLGQIGDPSAVSPIIEKMAMLGVDSTFSHIRSAAVALELLGDPSATDGLVEMLQKQGMSGHSFLDIPDAVNRTPAYYNDVSTREKALRELILARALYRCGDRDGMAREILERYVEDPRGVFSLHAQLVLSGHYRINWILY